MIPKEIAISGGTEITKIDFEKVFKKIGRHKVQTGIRMILECEVQVNIGNCKLDKINFISNNLLSAEEYNSIKKNSQF